jgi:diguanylate cyclase (GGDEF)-like protein
VWVLLLLTEVAALAILARELYIDPNNAASWERFVLLLAMAITFEEMSHQVGKLRLLVSTGPQPNMSSVWVFAGPLCLWPGQAALLALGVGAHSWIRLQRTAGQPFYRKAYSIATAMLACWAAGEVLGARNGVPALMPGSIHDALLLIGAMLVYTSVNRVLITAAIVTAGGPRSVGVAIGALDQNILELATMCLGFFTALAAVRQPALAPMIMIPTLLIQRGALVKDLERAAATDTKTQVLTALAWEQRATRDLALLERTEDPAAIMLIDLDKFKQLNDTFGHLVGDAALACVGAALKQDLRHGELVGRFGGEEFVVMVPGVGIHASASIAERLRQRISEISVADCERAGGLAIRADDIPISASIGVACMPMHGLELQDLLHAADVALYAAKHAGRNRVEVAGRPGGTEHSEVVTDGV